MEGHWRRRSWLPVIKHPGLRLYDEKRPLKHSATDPFLHSIPYHELPPAMATTPIQTSTTTGVNPLGCHRDVLSFSERIDKPAESPSRNSRLCSPPRVQITEDESDFDYDELEDAVIFSPSIGDLNSYARHTPSPARSSYSSVRRKTLGSTSPNLDGNHQNVPRSTTSLSVRDNLLGKATKKKTFSALRNLDQNQSVKAAGKKIKRSSSRLFGLFGKKEERQPQARQQFAYGSFAPKTPIRKKVVHGQCEEQEKKSYQPKVPSPLRHEVE